MHSLRERFLGWNGELSSKQLDEHRGRRRKKEVNKVHEGVKVQKKFEKTEDGCAAGGAETFPAPPRGVGRGGGVRVSACVVWMLNNNKKSLENGVFLYLSHREKSNKAIKRGIEVEKERG